MTRSIAFAFALSLVTPAALPAQTLTPIPLRELYGNQEHGLYGGAAFDADRGRLVLRNGIHEGTWEAEGGQWELRSSGSSPGTLAGPMVYDSARQRTVLFAGDTFEWDGFAWERKFPTHRPPTAIDMGMAYDTRRNRTVLVTGAPLETWEWDGNDWTQRQPTHVPPGGAGPWPEYALAYDLARGVAVLYVSFTGQTWEWDGSDWTLIPTPGISGIQIFLDATFDERRARVVVSAWGGLWEYDGQTWSLAQPWVPQGLVDYDVQRGETLVLLNGTEILAWDGTRTMQIAGPSPSSPAQIGVALVADPRRRKVLALGGSLDDMIGGSYPVGTVREWDGRSWSDVSAPTAVAERRNVCAVYDPTAQHTLVFGGEEWVIDPRRGGSFQPANDTWSWNGATWAQLAPTNQPPASYASAMVWEAHRNRAILLTDTSATRETWEWNGANWTPRSTTRVPPAVDAMAYDPAGRTTLLFTGSETWVFQNDDWSMLSPTTSPSPRHGTSMAYLPNPGRVVLYGGNDGQPLDDLWAWSGSDWQPLATMAPLPASAGPAMALDPARDALLVQAPSVAEFFHVGLLTEATASRYGQGCATTGAVPRILASDPSLRNATLQLELLASPASTLRVLVLSTTQGSIPVGSCTLLIGTPEVTLPLSTGSGSAAHGSVRLPLPLDLAFRGVAVHAQGFAVDPVTAALSMSQGLSVTIGD